MLSFDNGQEVIQKAVLYHTPSGSEVKIGYVDHWLIRWPRCCVIFSVMLALIQFPPRLDVLQQSFGRSDVARFHEGFRLMLGADVIGRPHFLHFEALGDDSNRIAFLPEGG